MNLTDALEAQGVNASTRIEGGSPHAITLAAARRMADLEARVDAGAEIWAETPCEHGHAHPHVVGRGINGFITDANDTTATNCPGGERERLMG